METDGLNQRDIDNGRKALWRQRRKHQPKLPISRMDALRAISEIETRQDVKIVTDDETQIACVYSPSSKSLLACPTYPLDVCESYAFDILEQAPDDQRINEYLEYLAKTYICSHSSFPPTLWASTDVCSKRTTNGSEAFYRKLNSLFYASHPSVFE